MNFDYDQDIEKLCENNHFMNYNHMRMVECKDDTCIVELKVVHDSLNPYEIIHGGALYTMADCACGIAARKDGRRYVTLSSQLNFLLSAKEGDTVRAVGHIRHRGRTTAFADVDITNQDGKIVASGGFTFFCLNNQEKGKPTT